MSDVITITNRIVTGSGKDVNGLCKHNKNKAIKTRDGNTPG